MRRAKADYEDKSMAPKEPPKPAPPKPTGPAVDVRPSERELAEESQEGKPRPSERENAEEIARRTQEAQEEAPAPEKPEP